MCINLSIRKFRSRVQVLQQQISKEIDDLGSDIGAECEGSHGLNFSSQALDSEEKSLTVHIHTLKCCVAFVTFDLAVKSYATRLTQYFWFKFKSRLLERFLICIVEVLHDLNFKVHVTFEL